MTQNIRDEFKYEFLSTKMDEQDADLIVDFFISHHNTTLKEIEDSIEEEKRQIEIQLLGEKDPEVIEYLTGKRNFANDVIQLIHQKLIK